MSKVAVFDIGKTNLKLSVASRDGRIIETVSRENQSFDGPPYRHHDVQAVGRWLLAELALMASRHAIDVIVPCAHGSGSLLVDAAGPLMPMIDYEQETPSEIARAYKAVSNPYAERGSSIKTGAGHIARQLFWLQSAWPERTAAAEWLLGLPQYWAWWLTGTATSEVTYLAAQSHLWNAAGRRPARIVAEQHWQRLLPPMLPAWQTVGRVKVDVARFTGLSPDTRVLCGIHDSSANFYRYQAAGLSGMAVISTGTWIVGLTDRIAPDHIDERRGMTFNADVGGRVLGGVQAMGGREFATMTHGAEAPDAAAGEAIVRGLVRDATFAVPSFASFGGLFAGSAGRGHITGPLPLSPQETYCLAVLYIALLTDSCLTALRSEGLVVLDGPFVNNRLYTGLVAALRPGDDIVFNLDSYGTASGAALLADHETRTAPVPLSLEPVPVIDVPGLSDYRDAWFALADAMS
ncbi:FGGY family carbohydrate kinase [Corticibacterium sp. UT-5YL-CI-8]|nr:FGGY family carbohydrate kinase [Tianweitania sp. UT-5YL-CI-8]